MKKKFIYLASLLGLCVFTGCEQEDDDESFNNLDVSSIAPLTRSSMADLEGGGDPGKQRGYENKKYNSLPNCCGINTLVDAWIKSKDSGYFEREYCPMTAQQYYDKLVNECKNDISYHWTPDSASMKLSTLEMLNEKFPLKSHKKKDGTIETTYTFSDTREFNNPSDISVFFSDSKNRRSVTGVMLEDANGNGHIANVSSCTKSNVYFTGYDIFNDDGSFSGGNISTDGNGKDGWRIIGVLLK
jgi:hypothetical protein